MIGVYPGSFDPLTMGHCDIARRASKMCGKLYVAILENINKTPLFSIEERIMMAKEALKDIHNVEVESFSGLLVDYMKKKNAEIIVRGLRAVSDFEYEFQIALVNRNLNNKCETIFMIPSQQYIFLSSTVVRDIARNKGNVAALVPDAVLKKLKEKFG